MQHDTGSVRSKLILMAVSTTLVALLSASIAMLLYDLRTFQQYWVDDLMTQADIIASVTAPALACVWELAVTGHERNAWIRHMLTARPDAAAYLDDVLPAGRY